MDISNVILIILFSMIGSFVGSTMSETGMSIWPIVIILAISILFLIFAYNMDYIK